MIVICFEEGISFVWHFDRYPGSSDNVCMFALKEIGDIRKVSEHIRSVAQKFNRIT